MIGVHVQIDRASAEARRRVAEVFSGALGDYLAKDTAKFEAQQNEQAFASQGEKSGGRWAALSEGYAEHKRKRKPNAKILVWGGGLRDSLRHVSKSGHIARNRGGVLEYGTSHHLAPFHQEGTRHMPERPPVRKSVAQAAELKKRIAQSLLGVMARAARGAMAVEFRNKATSLRADPRVG